MLTSTIPEPGQLVDVRLRRYVVTEVLRSGLPPELDPKGIEPASHLVTLSSLEDDALGEELQVIWELEPGARAFEKAALPTPDGFDEPRRLDAFLDAVRWGAVSQADISALQSPFRSGIDIEDYQLDPVVRALKMPRVSLLVADDVGLGKTIEAGLVLQELLLRHRARTILVVCPSSLQIQWRDQMRDKFGLEFRIIDSAFMKELRRQRGLHVNPWTHFPRLITSIDFLKRDRPMRLMREILPAEGQSTYPRKFDILVVDEAHNVAPSGGGNYATDSQRTLAIRTLAPHFEHKLFLTATPHNGYQESFSALLELLDNQRFARAVMPGKEQLAAVMVRRLKSELPPDEFGKPRFPVRVIEPLEVLYSEEERAIHRLLRNYVDLRKARLSNASAVEQHATEFVLKLLKKRLFSSPAAFATTLEQHLQTMRAAKKTRPVVRVTPGILRRRLEEIDEEYADDDAYEENMQEAVETAGTLITPLTTEEEQVIRQLQQYADAASVQLDAKAKTLIDWLLATVKPHGAWSNERVLIFTEYRTTQKWLFERLAAHGLSGGDRLQLLYGGMKSEDREDIKAAFQADPKDSAIRILLATDAASEGIDLQNHCHRLIHYEIPWNPNRMEQRNGRLDRHGQKSSEVQVYHFVGKGVNMQRIDAGTPPGELEGDLEFLLRAAMKVETIREDLGKVGPVIASQVEQAMLGYRRTLDTAKAEAEAQAPRRMLRLQRDIREQIKRLHDQLLESRGELRLSPENVKAVVDVALEIAGQPALFPVALDGVWPNSTGQYTSSPVFEMPQLTNTWARCSEGLAHPHTKVIRPITFDQAVAKGRDDVVLVHLNHRLVQMALRLLRGEIWATDIRRQLHRVTARVVPDHALDAPAIIAYGRLVVLGGDNHRLHEEIITAGGVLDEGKLVRMNVGQVKRALEFAQMTEPSPAVKESFVDRWPYVERSLTAALDARMRERTENLQKFLDERAQTEVIQMTATLTELAERIRLELKEDSDEQLLLWTEPEKEQLRLNRQSLQDRLTRIPVEIERETEAIRQRYANPTPRLFPVAVTFLVPRRIA